MAKRKALGRGLGAYFPNLNKTDESDEVANPSIKITPSQEEDSSSLPDAKNRVHTVARIPIDHIRANPFQPRTDFKEADLQELADSIKEYGIVQPLTVRYLGDDRFELISGERRLRAAKRAELHTVPGYIIDADNEQMMAIAIIENIQRSDLNPIEVALGYQRLIEECNYTQEVLAQKVGKNRSTVTNMLRLLQLPAAIQRALIDNEISTGHARALLSISNQVVQLKALKAVMKGHLSVRQTEQLVKKLLQSTTSSSPDDLLKKTAVDPFLSDISKRLRDHFSTKIDIKKKKTGGELRISFHSDDDLQRLIELIGL